VVPPVVTEELFIYVFLHVLPVAPEMDAPEPVFEVADLSSLNYALGLHLF